MMRILGIYCSAVLVLSAHNVQAAPPELNPEEVVRQWAAASQAIAVPGKSARQRIVYEHRDELNGHQLGLLVECRGPVDAEDLLGRYRFTKAVRSGGSIRLTAVPRDDVERLLVPRWEIDIARDTRLPAAITFDGSQRSRPGHRIAILSRLQRLRITLAPPAPAQSDALVRLAAADDSTEGDVVNAAGDPPIRRMPNLIGMPWDDVIGILVDGGYRVKLRGSLLTGEETRFLKVIDHSPLPGASLGARATVVLTVRH